MKKNRLLIKLKREKNSVRICFKIIPVILFILASFVTAFAVCEQDSSANALEKEKPVTAGEVADSSSFRLTGKPVRPAIWIEPLLSEQFSPALRQTLKYDTTWDNPEDRCYEFKKPISQKYLFLFKFISRQQYEVHSLP